MEGRRMREGGRLGEGTRDVTKVSRYGNSGGTPEYQHDLPK
jgi:hypothetical protein